MKIEPGTSKLYPLTKAQNIVLYQQQYTLHKNVQNIPFYFTTEKKIDFEIMKKAVYEELRRNDALRMRILKDGKNIYQFFAPSVDIGEIPVYEFSSQEEQDRVLGRLASATLKPYKNQLYTIVLFRTGKKYGVFICIHHVCLDGMAVNILFKDLCAVYDALENGTDMPKPMASFEEYVAHELEVDNDSEKRKKDADFFRELMASEGEPYYAGVDRHRRLDNIRKKKKKPGYRSIPIFDPIHEKTDKISMSISPRLLNEVKEACKAYSISPLEFISSAMRIYLSAVNRDCNDVTIMDTVSRRVTAASRNMGGCLVHSADIRTVFKEDEPFFEVAQGLLKRYMQIFRHIDMDTLEMLDVAHDVWKHPEGDDYISMIFSYMPIQHETDDKWNREYGG